MYVDINLIYTVMCLEMYPELCINSNTQKQPQHLCVTLLALIFTGKSTTQQQCAHEWLKHRADSRVVTRSSYGGLTRSQPRGSGQQQCQSSYRTADGLVPAEKYPQAGTSQPVRHASLTLRPRIKVSKERRRRRGRREGGS